MAFKHLQNAPRRFNDTTTQRAPMPRDYIVAVDRFELNDAGSGVLFGHNPEKPEEKYRVTIDPSLAARASSGAGEARFMPSMIDGRLAAAAPAGKSWVIVQGARRAQSPARARDKDAPTAYTARWILPVVPNAEKTFRAVVTASPAFTDQDGVRRTGWIAAWERTTVNLATEQGTQFLDTITRRMDDDARARQDGTFLPYTYGFRIFAVGPAGKDARGRATVDVLDSTPPYLWRSPEKDEAGNVTVPGGPFTGQDLQGTIDEYIKYLEGRFGKEATANMNMEIAFARCYATSKRSSGVRVGTFGVLQRLTGTALRVSTEEGEEDLWPNTLAVDGPVALAPDKLDPVANQVVHVNLVNHVPENGYIAALPDLLQTSSGERLVAPPALRAPPRAPRTEEAASTTGAPTHAPVAAPVPAALAAAATELTDDWGSDDGDPFAPAASTPAPAAAAPPPEQSPAARAAPAHTAQRAPSAPAPAVAPAPASAPTSAAPAKPRGLRRFGAGEGSRT